MTDIFSIKHRILQVHRTFSLHRGDKLLQIGKMYTLRLLERKKEEQEFNSQVIKEEILVVNESDDDGDENEEIKIVDEIRSTINEPKFEIKFDRYKREKTARPKSIKERLGKKLPAAQASMKAQLIKTEQASEDDEWAPANADEEDEESEGDQKGLRKHVHKRRVMSFRDMIKDQDSY